MIPIYSHYRAAPVSLRDVVMATGRVITQKAMGRFVFHNFDSPSSHRNDSCLDVTFGKERNMRRNERKKGGK